MPLPRPRPDGPTPAVAAAVAGMVSVMAGASLAKTLFPVAGPLGVAAARLALSALVLAAVWRPWRVRVRRADLSALLAYGASLAVMNVLIYQAVARGPLGPAVALEFLGPLAVALLGSRRPLDLLWAGLAAAGVLTLTLPTRDAAPADAVGAGCALGAGACWAAYILAGRRVARVMPAGPAVALGSAVAAALVVPAAAVGSGGALLSPGVLASLVPGAVAVAVLSSVVPYPLDLFALGRLEARTFGVLMSLEPACGAVAGAALLGEGLTPLQWAAVGGVVLASAGSAATARSKPAALRERLDRGQDDV